MDLEIWKDIENFEGYQVSIYGQVRTYGKVTYTERHGYRYWKDKILKQKTDKNGYKRVILYKDGKPYTWLVHRLVAEAFIDNPCNYPIINHKDENPSNNYLHNLEWCTHKYNNTYGSLKDRYKKISF